MKNLLLILEIFLLCYVDAMPSSEFQSISKQKLIPVTLYTIPIDPPVQVLQVLYENEKKGKVKVDDKIGSAVKIKDVWIKFDTPVRDVKHALSRSYNIDVNKIECNKGKMTLADFEELFPTIPYAIKRLSRTLKDKVMEFFYN